MSISCLSLTHLLLGALNAIVFSFWVKLLQKKECLTRLAVHNGSVTYIYLKIVCCISDCKIEDALQLNAKLHSKRELCIVRNDTCRTYDVQRAPIYDSNNSSELVRPVETATFSQCDQCFCKICAGSDRIYTSARSYR